MRLTTSKMPVHKLLGMEKRKKLNFSLLIQRKDDIWDNSRKSLFIHSILTDFPIPPLYATKELRRFAFLDGKQRLSTALNFANNKFKLDEALPLVDGENIGGLLFKELPSKHQEKISNYKFIVNVIENADVENLESIFFRLNNGMPLKQIELTRGVLGSEMLQYIEDISGTPFFLDKINVSRVSRKRFVEQELILQILSLIYNRNVGFSNREMQQFVKVLKEKSIKETLKAKIQNVSYYLNEVFPVKEKYLRKVHIPSLFIIALENQEKQLVIPPSEFKAWADAFFEDIPTAYFNASQSGSASRENVQTRIAEMRNHHHKHFSNIFKPKKQAEPPMDFTYLIDEDAGKAV